MANRDKWPDGVTLHLLTYDPHDRAAHLLQIQNEELLFPAEQPEEIASSIFLLSLKIEMAEESHEEAFHLWMDRLTLKRLYDSLRWYTERLE